MAPDITGILRQTALLGAVPDDDLAKIVKASRLRTFRRGQVVFTVGDPGDTWVVVLSGRVKVLTRSADGGELILTIVGPGGSFGELSIADYGPRSAEVETLEECHLVFVPRDVIRGICFRAPAAAEALAVALAATLRRLTEVMSDFVFLDIPRRVAKLLLSQSRDSQGVIQLALTQEELAHQVGSTRQTVNGALRGFERRGWIEVRDRSVTVKEAEALSRFAHHGVSSR
jgi:CRP/FNR family transcriptional regulator, cyclic AMP receptor protein